MTILPEFLWLGNWCWVHASSESLNAWGLDACVVVGLCGCSGTTEHIVGTCMGPNHIYRGCRLCTWAAQHQHAMLHKNCCVALGSLALFGFCKGGAVRTGGRYRDGMGGVVGPWGHEPCMAQLVVGLGGHVQ